LVGSGIAISLASTTYDIMEFEEGKSPPFGADMSTVQSAYVDSQNTLAAVLLPRSGLGTRLDIVLANTVGLIDADYQGEILMAVKNIGTEGFPIGALDRLVQMVIIPVLKPEFSVVNEFSTATARGGNGFGSTGKS
jgi:dUTP pyrophosphatase